jgi:hypothetical protein
LKDLLAATLGITTIFQIQSRHMKDRERSVAEGPYQAREGWQNRIGA